ncbi:MAG: RNA 2',3'-cyclic phosphodiesterase [Chloroflexota bacterium]
MAGIRSFLALDVPASVRASLAAVTARLASSEADVKWVETRNLHLTVKFLGDVPPERLPRLQESMTELAAAQTPFQLTISGLGAFPSLTEPNVIWAGLAAGTSELTALWKRVEEHCARIGFARERKPFSPHLTLGRQRSAYRQTALTEAIRAAADTSFGVVPVSGMTLYRSDLRPTGPVYTVQGEYDFGARKQ